MGPDELTRATRPPDLGAVEDELRPPVPRPNVWVYQAYHSFYEERFLTFLAVRGWIVSTSTTRNGGDIDYCTVFAFPLNGQTHVYAEKGGWDPLHGCDDPITKNRDAWPPGTALTLLVNPAFPCEPSMTVDPLVSYDRLRPRLRKTVPEIVALLQSRPETAYRQTLEQHLIDYLYRLWQADEFGKIARLLRCSATRDGTRDRLREFTKGDWTTAASLAELAELAAKLEDVTLIVDAARVLLPTRRSPTP